MGIIDGCIQALGCKTHTIIEAHPDVHRRMLADGVADFAALAYWWGCVLRAPRRNPWMRSVTARFISCDSCVWFWQSLVHELPVVGGPKHVRTLPGRL